MNRTWRRQENRRWWKPVTIGAAALAVTAGGLGVAMASENGNSTKAAGSIVCPDVAGQLPAIPDRAKNEVDRNLALLQTQINEANARLARDGDQGGPNFVNNAILGPLKDKRVSTIDRIAISIGRAGEKPQGLDRLAACSLSGDAAAPEAPAAPPADAPEAPPADAPEAPPADSSDAPPADSSDAPFGVISCPDVAGKLPDVPASAQAEIDRNLALLQTQIDEANARLSRDGDQGGPNFVQNAILGPLEDKRVATINRMATAIGRTAAKPVGLDALAPCALND